MRKVIVLIVILASLFGLVLSFQSLIGYAVWLSGFKPIQRIAGLCLLCSMPLRPYSCCQARF